MEKLLLGSSGVFTVALIVAWIAAGIGWVMNIIKLASVAMNHFTGNEGEVILRAVGVFFAPLGAIVGWF
jgi:hypothetical protein